MSWSEHVGPTHTTNSITVHISTNLVGQGAFGLFFDVRRSISQHILIAPSVYLIHRWTTSEMGIMTYISLFVPVSLVKVKS